MMSTLGTDKRTYLRTNSTIFAPFLINILCKVLKDCKFVDDPVNIDLYISKWGGGLKQIRKCYPKWDNIVTKCCEKLQISHPIWTKCIDIHPISNKNTFDAVDTCINLLQRWVDLGHRNRTFGPYPTGYEQELIMNEPSILQYTQDIQINIANGTFEPCYKANNASLSTSNQQSNMAVDNDEQKMIVLRDNMNNNNNDDDFDGINNRSHGVHTQDPRHNNNNNFGGVNSNNNNNNFIGHQAQHINKNVQNNGILYYQCVYYSEKQLKNIDYVFKHNYRNGPKLLFGDNNIDNKRKINEQRQYFGGQAKYCGYYDRKFAFGIITTWHKDMDIQSNNMMSSYFHSDSDSQTPIFNDFKQLMDKQFMHLINHIQSGCDVIVPSPTDEDLKQYPNKYFNQQPNFNDNNYRNQLMFKHNLGTGIASLQYNYLMYIQHKLNELENYASQVKSVYHPIMYGNNSPNPKQKRTHQSQNQNQNQKQSPFEYLNQKRFQNNNRNVTLKANKTNTNSGLSTSDPFPSTLSYEWPTDSNNTSSYNIHDGLPYIDNKYQNHPKKHDNKLKKQLNFDQNNENKQQHMNINPNPNLNPNPNPNPNPNGNMNMNINPNQNSNTNRYGSILWKSPQQKPQKQSLLINNNNYNNHNNQQITQRMNNSNQSNTNTPNNNNNTNSNQIIRTVPHYKSPTKYAVMDSNGNYINNETQNTFINNNNTFNNKYSQNNDNLNKEMIGYFLDFLCFIPRNIWLYLCVQNNPKGALRTFSIIFVLCAILLFIINGFIFESGFYFLMGAAIICAFLGGDNGVISTKQNTYQHRHYVSNNKPFKSYIPRNRFDQNNYI